MHNNVELDAAEALLDVGVSLPLRAIKIPFTKGHITVRVVMRRPKFGTLVRIARHYLKLGVTVEQMEQFSKHEELMFIAQHGKRVSRMVALTICRGYIGGILFTPVMAWLLRHFTPREFLYAANLQFLTLIGTKDFMPIIRSAQMYNPLRPNLSQQKKGS